jgi:hypothetical protein
MIGYHGALTIRGSMGFDPTAGTLVGFDTT